MENLKPELDQINLIARDFKRSLEFYRRLGIEIPEPIPGEDGKPFHVNGETANGLAFELDSSAFAKVWNPSWAAQGDLSGRLVLGFGVSDRADVDRLYRKLTEAGYPGLNPPHDAFWGARYAIVEDPDGIAVGLMSPIDPAMRSPTPKGWP
jgi:catechol 2,3-dioxygenase-like lactoylglutathione lyase family enzyme